MKLENCKEGIYILAKSKSVGAYYNYDDFLKFSPLGVGVIHRVDAVTIRVKAKGILFDFYAKDLIELENEI